MIIVFQVENSTSSPLLGEWSEVIVPVPYQESFSASWYYKFNFLKSGTVYDVFGLGMILHIYYMNCFYGGQNLPHSHIGDFT